jgi:CheY-like chemotaxis protein
VTAPESRGFVVVALDDDPTNLLLMTRILGRIEHLRVVAESDGGRGLELVRREHPDLIMLDLNLAGMSGEELMLELKRDATTAAIPVVVVSGDVRPEVRQRLRDEGAREFLEKPIEVSVVTELVRGILGIE